MKTRKIELTDYVNETVFDNLLIAKEHFDILLKKGKVSDQIIKKRNDLESYEAEYIDSGVDELYRYISKYVEAYENQEFLKCFALGRFLDDIKLSKDYLYRVLIRNNLPLKFQGDIKYDEFGNYMNADMDILITGGKRVHVLGKTDYITEMDYNPDLSSKIINQSKWVMRLPKVLMSRYSVLKDDRKDPDENVCYVWNKVGVERYIDREWKRMKLDATLGYGVKQARIATNDNHYFFEDQDGNVLGKLDEVEEAKAKSIIYVGDCLIRSKGNPEKLDSYLHSMNKHLEEDYKRHIKKK